MTTQSISFVIITEDAPSLKNRNNMVHKCI